MEPNSGEDVEQGGAAAVPEGAGGALSETDKAVRAAERWHELLTSRYVCEACLTRYFMKYRKCKACGEVGRIRLLTASLFDLADDDGELREMIANGQRMMFGEAGEGKEGEGAGEGIGGEGSGDRG